MTRFEIGPGLACDLDLLIASRLLVQASSGQGKTRTIRRLLEQTHGKVQHLVIDPEGEYHTLREQFDYVLAAPKGGDVVAHPKHAGLLAHKLLELGVSAICDIYELNPKDRILFVRRFFEALVNAARELWHPALVVLDEAHIFCPEKGDAESAEAVIALASRGRKRAFCLVAATQRLAKFKKDAAAELGNKLIGGCTLDVDVSRASDELGFAKADQTRLRRLKPGEFYAYGRAFRLDIALPDPDDTLNAPCLVKVGPVVSKHPEPGDRAVPTPPPTKKVKAILDKLSSLPAEAEEQEKSLATLQKENADLRRELQRQVIEPARLALKPERVEVPVLPKDVAAGLGAAVEGLRVVAMEGETLNTRMKGLMENAAHLGHMLAELERRVDSARQQVGPVGSAAQRRPVASSPAPRRAPALPTGQQFSGLDGPQQKIVDVLAMLVRRGLDPDKKMLAAWIPPCGIHPNGGRFNSNLAYLREQGYLEDRGVRLTEKGEAAAQVLDTGLRSFAAILDGAQKAIVDALDNYRSRFPEGRMSKQELADTLGIHPNGGRFNSNLARLRTMGAIPERGDIYLTEAVDR